MVFETVKHSQFKEQRTDTYIRELTTDFGKDKKRQNKCLLKNSDCQAVEPRRSNEAQLVDYFGSYLTTMYIVYFIINIFETRTVFPLFSLNFIRFNTSSRYYFLSS